MDKPKFTFQKTERIVLKKVIENIFNMGESLFVYPLKVRYTVTERENSDVHAKVLISVPKKNFKKAVHRNRIKRLMREAYRLNKHLLILSTQQQINVHFHYVSKNILPFHKIQESMTAILQQISEKQNKN